MYLVRVINNVMNARSIPPLSHNISAAEITEDNISKHTKYPSLYSRIEDNVSLVYAHISFIHMYVYTLFNRYFNSRANIAKVALARESTILKAIETDLQFSPFRYYSSKCFQAARQKFSVVEILILRHRVRHGERERERETTLGLASAERTMNKSLFFSLTVL